MWWAPVQRVLKWAQLAASAGQETQAAASGRPCTGCHENHICALASRREFSEIQSLTEKPAFVCANCGRVATTGQSLCNPFAFDKISFGFPRIG